MNEVIINMKKPDLKAKTGCAVFICGKGASNSGIATKATLMWPVRSFTDEDCEKEAVSFLSDVHIALLKATHLLDSEQIQKDQESRLDRLYEPHKHSNKNPSPEQK